MTKFQELKSRLRGDFPDQKDALDAAAAIEELEEALRPLADADAIEELKAKNSELVLRAFALLSLLPDHTTCEDIQRARAALGEDK
jgi:hypothetical protein